MSACTVFTASSSSATATTATTDLSSAPYGWKLDCFFIVCLNVAVIFSISRISSSGIFISSGRRGEVGPHSHCGNSFHPKTNG